MIPKPYLNITTTSCFLPDAVQSLADIPDSDDQPEADQLPEETAEGPDANRPLYRASTREDLLDQDTDGESSDVSF